MNEEDKTNYLKLNKPIYEVVLVYTSEPISGEFEYRKKSRSYCNVRVPDFKPEKAYKFKTLYLRNEESFKLLESFTLEALRSIFNFKIISQTPLNIDKIKKIDCGDSGYTSPLTGGFVPFSSPSLDKEFDSHGFGTVTPAVELMRNGKNSFRYSEDLSINYTDSDVLCMGSSFNNENFPNINKNLAKYFCQRRKSGIKFPLLVMLTHKYIEDGLVYRLNGSTDLTLEELSKISTLKIEY